MQLQKQAYYATGWFLVVADYEVAKLDQPV